MSLFTLIDPADQAKSELAVFCQPVNEGFFTLYKRHLYVHTAFFLVLNTYWQRFLVNKLCSFYLFKSTDCSSYFPLVCFYSPQLHLFFTFMKPVSSSRQVFWLKSLDKPTVRYLPSTKRQKLATSW